MESTKLEVEIEVEVTEEEESEEAVADVAADEVMLVRDLVGFGCVGEAVVLAGCLGFAVCECGSVLGRRVRCSDVVEYTVVAHHLSACTRVAEAVSLECTSAARRSLTAARSCFALTGRISGRHSHSNHSTHVGALLVVQC